MRTVDSIAPLEHEKPKLTKELTSYGTHRGRNPSVHRPTATGLSLSASSTHDRRREKRGLAGPWTPSTSGKTIFLVNDTDPY